MKKLYKVNIMMMVMAEDEGEARREALEADIAGCDFEVFEAKSFSVNWENAIPFGSDDDRTCGEIFRER